MTLGLTPSSKKETVSCWPCCDGNEVPCCNDNLFSRNIETLIVSFYDHAPVSNLFYDLTINNFSFEIKKTVFSLIGYGYVTSQTDPVVYSIGVNFYPNQSVIYNGQTYDLVKTGSQYFAPYAELFCDGFYHILRTSLLGNGIGSTRLYGTFFPFLKTISCNPFISHGTYVNDSELSGSVGAPEFNLFNITSAVIDNGLNNVNGYTGIWKNSENNYFTVVPRFKGKFQITE